MPIRTFSSVDDGLEPNQRNRGHFVTHIDADDQRLWVPYAEGVWFQPCCFNLTSGGSVSSLRACLARSLVSTTSRYGSRLHDARSLAIPGA
jgi:hypothetical protein